MTGMLTSPFWVGEEIFLGFSLPIFVGALIAAFGDQTPTVSHKPPGYAAAPRRLPNAGAFRLPVLDPPQLGPSRQIVGPGRLLTVGQIDAAGAIRPLTSCLGPAQRDYVNRKGLART
jgi:hypothetical protein